MNLDEVSDSIRENFNNVEKKMNELSKQKGTQRQESINKLQKRIDGTKRLIDHYKFAIEDSEEDNVQSHQSQLKEFQTKQQQLLKKIDFFRNENVSENDLFNHRKKQQQQVMGNRQQVIQKGHEVQKDSKDALNRIKGNVYKMEEQANQIGIELDRQINQLDGIYDNMKQTQTTLKRAQVHLRYFARQVYTDRLMICLIVVIILAIITIIILKIVGKTPQVQIDQLK